MRVSSKVVGQFLIVLGIVVLTLQVLSWTLTLALGPALGKSFRWPEIVVPIVPFSVLGQVLPAVLATIGGVLLIRRARAGRPVALAGFVVALIAGVGSLVFGYTAPVPSIALLVVIVVIGLIVALSGCELTPPSQ